MPGTKYDTSTKAKAIRLVREHDWLGLPSARSSTPTLALARTRRGAVTISERSAHRVV